MTELDLHELKCDRVPLNTLYNGSMDCTPTVRPQNGGDAATVPTAPGNMGTTRAFSIELHSSLLKSFGVRT
jgi:hypothetical protein